MSLAPQPRVSLRLSFPQRSSLGRSHTNHQGRKIESGRDRYRASAEDLIMRCYPWRALHFVTIGTATLSALDHLGLRRRCSSCPGRTFLATFFASSLCSSTSVTAIKDYPDAGRFFVDLVKCLTSHNWLPHTRGPHRRTPTPPAHTNVFSSLATQS